MMTGLTRGIEQHLADHPSSPLFARLADTLLNRGEITTALDLCERGVRIYPEYTTGRLVQARCLAASGNLPSAVQSLSEILENYPENIVLENLVDEWRGLIPVSVPPPTAPVAPPVTADPVPELPTAAIPGTAASPSHSPEPVEVSHVEISEPQATVPDDAVMFLGGESSASPPMRSPTGAISADRIISRTLAEIYASQGAIREAVETYRLLLERLPGRRDSYGGRLRELEERLRANPDGSRRPTE